MICLVHGYFGYGSGPDAVCRLVLHDGLVKALTSSPSGASNKELGELEEVKRRRKSGEVGERRSKMGLSKMEDKMV